MTGFFRCCAFYENLFVVLSVLDILTGWLLGSFEPLGRELFFRVNFSSLAYDTGALWAADYESEMKFSKFMMADPM